MKSLERYDIGRRGRQPSTGPRGYTTSVRGWLHRARAEVAGIQFKVGSGCRVLDGGGPAGADDHQDVGPLAQQPGDHQPRSFTGWQPVAIEETIVSRLPVTIQLGLMSIVIGLVIALPIGIYSAIRQDTSADYVGRSVAIVGLATPNFWLAMMVMLYPVIWWGLGTTDGSDSVHRRPAGKSRRVHHSPA